MGNNTTKCIKRPNKLKENAKLKIFLLKNAKVWKLFEDPMCVQISLGKKPNYDSILISNSLFSRFSFDSPS